MWIKIIAIALLLMPLPASAQTDSDMMNAMGETAGELQTCSVYFLVTTSCIEKQRPDIAESYRKAGEKLIGLAHSLKQAVGVSDAAYAAQSRLYLTAMMKAMGNNCTNIAVLQERYADFCQKLSRDADPRFEEWIGCMRARNQTCNSPGLALSLTEESNGWEGGKRLPRIPADRLKEIRAGIGRTANILKVDV